jgi:hypothetical protein
MTPRSDHFTSLDSEVLMAVTIKSTMFGLKVWCFGGTYFLHFQGRRVRHSRNSRSRGLSPSQLHGVTTQRTALFIPLVLP